MRVPNLKIANCLGIINSNTCQKACSCQRLFVINAPSTHSKLRYASLLPVCQVVSPGQARYKVWPSLLTAISNLNITEGVRMMTLWELNLLFGISSCLWELLSCECHDHRPGITGVLVAMANRSFMIRLFWDWNSATKGFHEHGYSFPQLQVEKLDWILKLAFPSDQITEIKILFIIDFFTNCSVISSLIVYKKFAISSIRELNHFQLGCLIDRSIY